MLHDKREIAAFLQQNVYLHIYGLGDLDDFFWNYTSWYALKRETAVEAIILLYTGQALPVLLALADDLEPMRELLGSLGHLLPLQFYTHLSPGLEGVIEGRFQLKSHGRHYKMGLKNRSRLPEVDCAQVVRLSKDDLADMLQLYKISYPGNWFDPRMLETNQYFGIRAGDELVSAAGVHVYSPQYRVAALGNITTHPDYRGRRLGRAVTAKLCVSLAENVDHIGLNVKSDNQVAISLYEKLGFEIISSYGEYMAESK
jgi:ribosomal protein S18 acetylase RimI-like enzyme